MKLIHCADLHLDSRLESNLPPAQAAERRQELMATFARLVSFALEEGVRVVMIAGDLFDSHRISPRTVDYILDQISRAENVDFLYLRGNHDESLRAFADRELPANLHLFSPFWKSFLYGSVCISGIEMTQENCTSLYETLQPDPAYLNIVMLHGQYATQPGPDLVCLPLLRGKRIRYLALGHLHAYRRDPLDADGEFCYSGCLEGRGYDECGEKGFVLLEIEGQQLRSSFHPFAQRTLWEVPVCITGLRTLTEFHQAMLDAAVKIPARDQVCFVWNGSCSPEAQKDSAFLLKLLENRFYSVKIRDESHLETDALSYLYDASLKGEFIRLVLASEEDDAEKAHIIRLGLQALQGGEIRS